jgi:hypothetical protein
LSHLTILKRANGRAPWLGVLCSVLPADIRHVYIVDSARAVCITSFAPFEDCRIACVRDFCAVETRLEKGKLVPLYLDVTGSCRSIMGGTPSHQTRLTVLTLHSILFLPSSINPALAVLIFRARLSRLLAASMRGPMIGSLWAFARACDRPSDANAGVLSFGQLT